MQRSRMLAAALEAIDELGYPRVTVAHVTVRARVSRRTFYELFGNREDCLLAALESVVELVGEELARVGIDNLSWRERVRTGLWMILAFLEREPMLARVVVVQALRGGPRVLESRERALAMLADVVDEGRLESARGVECQPLTAEGLVGAAFAIVYGRLLRGEREPLTGLFGELMEMIVRPYMGPAAARRERARPVPVAAPSAAVASGMGPVVSDDEPAGGRGGGSGDPLVGVPMRLTYRTALVLEAIAGRPGVSNRVVGDLAGISDQGQISKLLARLERLGLAQNTGGGHVRGEPNAWSLTELGCEVALRLRANVVVRGEGV
ncbi:MAG TPA: TetR family transcriptional regulator [Solirubrobacteraceae bacterium]|nr:TetR family transcriptional regulator [Solirubrobacteraceae bacterium]